MSNIISAMITILSTLAAGFFTVMLSTKFAEIKLNDYESLLKDEFNYWLKKLQDIIGLSSDQISNYLLNHEQKIFNKYSKFIDNEQSIFNEKFDVHELEYKDYIEFVKLICITILNFNNGKNDYSIKLPISQIRIYLHTKYPNDEFSEALSESKLNKIEDYFLQFINNKRLIKISKGLRKYSFFTILFIIIFVFIIFFNEEKIFQTNPYILFIISISYLFGMLFISWPSIFKKLIWIFIIFILVIWSIFFRLNFPHSNHKKAASAEDEKSSLKYNLRQNKLK